MNENSIFPFLNQELAEAGAVKLEKPLLKEYAWDFQRNEFVLENGKPKIVEGLEALKIWIYKALSTKRYAYLAYSWDYGSELEDLIGKGYNREILQSECKRSLSEALMLNPYIKSITNLETEIEGSKITVHLVVNTDYGEVEINV